jgi:aerobic-type carbon monoxide dehydrogenase small subunit (CoxS/CutS family)
VTLTFNVNGREIASDADPLKRLSRILREDLGLTGLKEGCCEGECGACTVLMDGAAVHACLVLGFQAEGHDITTIEGLGDAGRLTYLQATFVATGAVQCGYCTPGMVMSAEALLRAKSDPDADDIRHALAGNICRCTGFDSIVRAVATEASRRRDSRT